jgi:hypothetical protein
MPDEQRFPEELFSLPQAVGPDEDGAHAVGDRADDIAAEVIADEQHLVGRCFGGCKDKLVEERVRLADAERVGEQGDAEQVVDSGFLKRGPACLVRLGVGGTLPHPARVAARPGNTGHRRRPPDAS